MRGCVAVAVTTGAVLSLAVPPHAAACGGLLALVVSTVWQQSRGRAMALAQKGRDADALSALAAELRAGHDLASAFTASAASGSASFGRAMSRAGQAIRMGEPPENALDRGEPSSLVTDLAGLVRLSGEHGAPLAEVVDVLAADTRGRVSRSGDLAGLLAGPRATAGLLAGLPVFGIVMGEAIGAHPLQTLLHTSAGAMSMIAGTLLAAVGVWWTQALVRSAEE